jgi:hypothetical protein
MKAAAVDCELSYKQNKDGKFECLPLEGAVGDFIYDPILEQDILASAGKFNDNDICVGNIKSNEMFKVINKVAYLLKEVVNNTGTVIGYDAYEAIHRKDPKNPDKMIAEKKVPEKKLGTVGVRMIDGVPQPGPPVNIPKPAEK